MSHKIQKLINTILNGASDNNIYFEDLRNLILHFGLTERIKGSHHIFIKTGIKYLVNLQRDGNKAKSYQVRQVRKLILKYQLNDEKI